MPGQSIGMYIHTNPFIQTCMIVRDCHLVMSRLYPGERGCVAVPGHPVKDYLLSCCTSGYGSCFPVAPRAHLYPEILIYLPVGPRFWAFWAFSLDSLSAANHLLYHTTSLWLECRDEHALCIDIRSTDLDLSYIEVGQGPILSGRLATGIEKLVPQIQADATRSGNGTASLFAQTLLLSSNSTQKIFHYSA